MTSSPKPSTDGYVYDLDALRRGLKSIVDNIAALEEGLEREQAKKLEYEGHITAAEAILRLHDDGSH